MNDPEWTLESLKELSEDLWWSWNEIGRRPFAMIDPMLGMMFSRNASRPNTNARSTPRAQSVRPTSEPVSAESRPLTRT